MKQKDIALIVVVVVISAIVSYFISNKIFVTPSNRQQKAYVVQAITSDFPYNGKHFKQYFNNKSIDPTQLIQISPNNNTNPFNSSPNGQ